MRTNVRASVLLALALIACEPSSDSTGSDVDGGADLDGSDGRVETPDASNDDASSPDGGAVDSGVDGTECPSAEIRLTQRAVDVMFMLQSDGEMEDGWNDLKVALELFAAEHPSARLGVHASRGRQIDELDGFFCESSDFVLDLDIYQTGRIPDAFDLHLPSAATAPMLASVARYAAGGVGGLRSKADTLLVPIARRGGDCIGSVSSFERSKAAERVASDVQAAGVRVLPIAIGNDAKIDPVLMAFARYGGSRVVVPLSIASESELTNALQAVKAELTSCRVDVDGADALKASDVGIYLGNERVLRDPAHVKGWDFVDPDRRTLELFGAACEQLRSGERVEARVDCAQGACVDRVFDLALPPATIDLLVEQKHAMMGPTTFPTDPSEWRDAREAISALLADPALDRGAIGMRLYSGSFCPVDEGVEVAQRNALPIITTLPGRPTGALTSLTNTLGNVTFGTPLLTASGPKAVIVVSYSRESDTCTEMRDPIAESEAFVSDVHDAGVDVYAVRYGASEDAAHVALLAAVANQGGTGQQRVAKTGTALRDAFTSVLDDIVGCELALPDGLSATDIARMSVTVGERQLVRGTDFRAAPDAGAAIELLGEACRELRAGHLGVARVELGCK